MGFRIGMAAVAASLAAGAAMAQTTAQTTAQTAAQTPAAPAAAVTPVASTDWRTVSAENLLVIDTSRGRVLVELAPETAPLHVERIRLLARRGFYDGLVWHRVIDWFMAQTGDPLGTGEGQSPYPDLKAEFTFRRDARTPFTPVAAPAGAVVGFLYSLPVQTQPDAAMAQTGDGKVHGWGLYCPGVAGMARDEGNDTANSQFFLMRQAYPALEKRYSVWGQVISGLDVVRTLKVGDGDNGVVTAEPDRMTRVRVAADIPEAERPTARVLDTTTAAFRTLAERVRSQRGADFSICDVELPVQVDTPAA